jgi:Ran GTPase-activating protein (RanGAP) involved in mRNA processing and transport
MKYTSVNEFVEDATRSMERQDETFTVLDITDPLAENELLGEESRFDPSLEESFDAKSIIKLLTLAKKSPHVNDLFLGYADIDHITSLLLLELFQEDRKWKRLALQGCAGRISETCVVLLVTLGKVESFCLYQNEMEYELFASLGMILATNPKYLTTLDLEAYFFDEGAEALAHGLSKNITLEHLDLYDCRFGGHAAYILAKGLQGNRHLESLQLGLCNLGDDEVAAILEALQDHPRIQRIFLDCNHSGPSSSETMSLMLAGNRTPNLLQLSLKLQHDVEPGNVDWREPLDFGMLAASLHLNSCLQHLCLSHNRLSLRDVSNLMAGVKESAIRILHLEVCGISDEGAQNISSNLNTGLVEIHLAGNVFSNESCEKYFLESIRVHTQLEFLHVGEEYACQIEIDYYARLNKGGRRIFSNPSRVPLALWTLVLDRANRLDWQVSDDTAGEGFAEDVLFYMLQGPVLCERRWGRRF